MQVDIEARQLHIRLEQEAPALRVLVQHIQKVVTLQVGPLVNGFLGMGCNHEYIFSP